jgi:hypothetical protein
MCLAVNAVSTVAWNTSYYQAVQSVLRTDRPLFIVFESGRPNAGEAGKQQPFLSGEVETALAANYVRLFVDLDTEKGKRVAEQFQIRELPSIVVIDRSTDWQVYKRSGAHTSNELLAVLERYRRTKIVAGPGPVSEPTVSYPGSWSQCKT